VLRGALPARPDSTRFACGSSLPSVAVGAFFINYEDGRIATRDQLAEARLVDDELRPIRPWHPIQGPSDASTMWYAVMRKRERGIFMGQLTVRHAGGQASLEERGWEEVPVDAIGV
jgi:hypothetical protein